MTKLTPPQREVLELLAEYGARNRPGYTASTTYKSFDCCYVSGSAAKALVAKGLAKYTRGYQIGIPGSTIVTITDDGKEELR